VSSKGNGVARLSFQILSILTLLALPLLACKPSDRPLRPDEAVVTVLAEGDGRILGPAWDDTPKFLVFQSLTRYEEYYGGAPALPGLAVSWEASEDYREWTVTLHEDLRWHDGAPVTAYDVEFTVDLWNHPDVLFYAGGGYGEITVVDDMTFTVSYTEPNRNLLGGWNVFYPKHLLEDLDPGEFYQWSFWSSPVGTGPFRFVRYVPETSFEFVANEDYIHGRPAIDRVFLKLSGGAPLAELLSGAVDIAPLSSEEAQRLSTDKRFRVYETLAPNRHSILWNNADPVLGDPRVRAALTLSIDRRALHAAMGYSDALPIYDGVCTSRQFRFGKCGEALPHDPALASDRLAELGWADTDADGLLDLHGNAFSFELLIREDLLAAAVFIQQELKKIGVEMEVRVLAGDVVNQRITASEFQAAVRIFPNSARHHQGFFSTDVPAFGSDAPFAVSLHSAEADTLLHRAVTSMDADEKDRTYERLSEIVREQMPITYLFPKVGFVGAHRRIKGLESPFRVAVLWRMGELWIEDSD
jgi:peptide/nickel transport system substrate-binding protein